MTNSKNSINSSGLAGGFAAESLDQAAVQQMDKIVKAGEGFWGRILRGPTPGNIFSYFLLVPSVIALAISCYLGYVSVTASEIAGCGTGLFDCSHVLTSKYSSWMGLPVSLMAAGVYAVMVASLLLISSSGVSDIVRRISWAVVSVCGISAGLAAVWFVSVQAFILEHYCPWCLGAHLCGTIIAIALLIKRPFGTQQTLVTAGLAGVGIGVLIFGQVSAEEKQKYEIIEHPVVPAQDEYTGGTEFAPPMDEDGSFFSAPDENEQDSNVFQAPDSVSNEPATNVKEDIENSVSMSSMHLLKFLNINTTLLSYSPQEEGSQAKQEEGSQAKQEEGSQAKQEEGSESKEGSDSKPERRLVTIPGNVQLDARQWPLLGSPNAKYIYVEMFDYACPHCRATHQAVKGASEAMGDEVAVLVLPVPLNSNCNSNITVTGANFGESCDMAHLAVACWRIDAAKFQEFHHWMFEGASIPTYANAKFKVEQLVGKDKLDDELSRESCRKYIAKHVELYRLQGAGLVPKLLFPSTSVQGEYTSVSGLVNLIRNNADDK